MDSENNKNFSRAKSGLVFTAMGFELVGIILTCLYFGQELDKKYGLGGLGVAGLSMIGLAGWLTHLVVLLKKFGMK